MENQLLLLDEATVGLDPESKNELFKILLNWQKENNSGFIFSSHDMNDVLNYAEEVIVMSEEKFYIIQNLLSYLKNIVIP